jgi:hypothetical protein
MGVIVYIGFIGLKMGKRPSLMVAETEIEILEKLLVS